MFGHPDLQALPDTGAPGRNIVTANAMAPTFLAGGGVLGDLIRRHDWAATALGPPCGWPETLKTLMRVMLASRQPMFIAWGPERLMLYNDGYAPLCGNRHPWALGRRFDEVWADILADVGPIMDAAYAGIPTYMDDIRFVMRRNGFDEETHFSFGYTPVTSDATGEVAGMFCTCLEITPQIMLSREREAELQRLTEIFSQAPSPTALMTGPDHVFELANPAYLRLVGRDDVVGRTLADVLPDLARQGVVDLLDTVYRTREPRTGEDQAVLFSRGDGAPVETRYLDYVLHPILSGDGVRGIFVQASDVTARHEAQAMQALLNQELSHRMKNQIAVVQSIVTQSLRGAASLEDARKKVSARLGVLARAHEMLLVGRSERAPVGVIVRHAIDLHQDTDGHRFSIDGPAVEFDGQGALSLALILQELATNAAKYGALSAPDGRVSIRWEHAELDGAPAIALRWAESGGPPVTTPAAKGFGSRLILGGIAGANSRPEIAFAPDGVVYDLLVAVPPPLPEGG